ncbi:MAG: hypothetical protein ABSE18_00690 [Minisyncoccia bacterium]
MTNIEENRLSYEFIRGLIVGEGCFTFCGAGIGPQKSKIPTFALAMSEVDSNLITLVRDRLTLKNKVYNYGPRKSKDQYSRMGRAVLMVRDFGQLKNVIVPLCYKKLHGNKAKQFEEWMEKIGSEPYVQESYRFIYKIYKAGFYENIHKYDF